MALKYYFDLMSQPSRAVYIFLKMNNIPFVPKPVALRSGEHHTDEFKKLNPMSLVPVIDDDGFVLTESVAILKYMALKYNVPDHWYPRDLKAQARVDEYMNYQHINTRYNCGMVFQQLVIIPRAMRAPIQWPMVDNAKNRLETVIAHLENYFLKDNKQKFLCGSDISVADLLGVCELMQLYACCEENIYESNSAVKAWVDRVKERTAPHFEDANKIVKRVRGVYSKQKEAQQNAKL